MCACEQSSSANIVPLPQFLQHEWVHMRVTMVDENEHNIERANNDTSQKANAHSESTRSPIMCDLSTIRDM